MVGQKDMSKTKMKKSDVDVFVDEPLVFQNDIYSLAFAAMLNPDDEFWKKAKDIPNHIPKITMLNYEREVLYSGAFCVAIMQGLYLYILYTFIGELEIKGVDNFMILIPRILSSLMMHMVVMPDARQGLRIMKFVFKHP